MLDTDVATTDIAFQIDPELHLTAEGRRALRRRWVFIKADAYQTGFWEFAHALYQFDLNQDWRFDWNATQEAKCQSLSEWVAAHQEKLKVSPSWAMYMAGLPGLHQAIQSLIDPADTALSTEVHKLVHTTDPSRIQVVQSTVNKRLKIARAIKTQARVNPELVDPDDVRQAVADVIEPLQVAAEAETRKDVEDYVDGTKGIIHRTVHISVAELDQATRGRFEITDLPADAIVALDIWYNPKRQAEYKAEMAAKATGSPETSAEQPDSSSEPE